MALINGSPCATALAADVTLHAGQACGRPRRSSREPIEALAAHRTPTMRPLTTPGDEEAGIQVVVACARHGAQRVEGEDVLCEPLFLERGEPWLKVLFGHPLEKAHELLECGARPSLNGQG